MMGEDGSGEYQVRVHGSPTHSPTDSNRSSPHHHMCVPLICPDPDPQTCVKIPDDSTSSCSDDSGVSGGGGERRPRPSTRLMPEYKKLVVAFLYYIAAGFCTGISIVWTNDSVPITNRPPPLPDPLLDALPLYEHYIEFSEFCVFGISYILFFTLTFHRHRFIILRRVFAIGGTIYFFRCVTVLVTFLPVPTTSRVCTPFLKEYHVLGHLKEAARIMIKGGLKLNGALVCGDYIFSGHSTTGTLFTLFVLQSIPQRLLLIKGATVMLYVMAVVFLFISHEHYTIDIVIAVFIVLTLFKLYHCLASAKFPQERKSFVNRLLLPLFNYCERNIDGVVPNEYENPFSYNNRQWAKIQLGELIKWFSPRHFLPIFESINRRK